ncbi:MAG: aspartate/glutamate racemase family protein, partial [Candidatus Bathyarchaeia archaeon]
MRLGVIVTSPRLGNVGLQRRLDSYRRSVSSGTEVVLEKTTGGPDSTDSRYEELLAGPYIIDAAKKLASKNVSAIIVNCFLDPAVGALRELFNLPVVGPGEASILTSTMVGSSFSILTILDNGISIIEELVRKIGLSGRLASVRALNMKPDELESNSQRVEEVLVSQARSAVYGDGASVLVLGCTSPEIAFAAEKLSNSLKVPVINPVRAAVQMAESLARQKLSSSRSAY